MLWLGLQCQTVDARERARGAVGAVLGLWFAGALSWLGWGAGSPWLAAPMGASTVLLFGGPSSPLAQPWPMMVGNVMSALVGVAVFQAIGSTPVSAALAAGLALALLHRHRIRALPVVDRARRVIGMVTLVDFLKHAQLDPRDHLSLGRRIRQLLTPTPGIHSEKSEVVGQIMTSPVQTATEHESVVELVPRLSDQGLHHVPVVDDERRLSGMVTQSDLVAALYRAQDSGQPSSN